MEGAVPRRWRTEANCCELQLRWWETPPQQSQLLLQLLQQASVGGRAAPCLGCTTGVQSLPELLGAQHPIVPMHPPHLAGRPITHEHNRRTCVVSRAFCLLVCTAGLEHALQCVERGQVIAMALCSSRFTLADEVL
eukprot:scaffold3043_cov360-Prasinococcus_capsulatus_cf.AAC.17